MWPRHSLVQTWCEVHTNTQTTSKIGKIQCAAAFLEAEEKHVKICLRVYESVCTTQRATRNIGQVTSPRSYFWWVPELPGYNMLDMQISCNWFFSFSTSTGRYGRRNVTRRLWGDLAWRGKTLFASSLMKVLARQQPVSGAVDVEVTDDCWRGFASHGLTAG